jgi:hypothetical protein
VIENLSVYRMRFGDAGPASAATILNTQAKL